MNTGPVQPIPTDDDNRPPEPTSALCLSGGGYRAMVFHIGVLWRLYETGLLQNNLAILENIRNCHNPSHAIKPVSSISTKASRAASSC